MTEEELLNNLREIEGTLRSNPVQTLIKRESDETRARFVSILNNLSVAINRLGNDQLRALAGKLSELDGQLTNGIEATRAVISRMNSAIEIVNTVSSVLSTVSLAVGLFI